MNRLIFGLIALLATPAWALNYTDAQNPTGSVATDFSGSYRQSQFVQEIAGAGLSSTLIDAVMDGDSLVYHFNSALSGADQTTLDGLVTAHTPLPAYKPMMAAPYMIRDSASAPNDTFSEVGTAVPANMEELLGGLPLSKAVGRFRGFIKTNGTGTKIRFVEKDATGGSAATLGTFDVPDTSGAWQFASFWSDTAPRSGDWAYCFEYHKNGATTLEVKSWNALMFIDTE